MKPLKKDRIKRFAGRVIALLLAVFAVILLPVPPTEGASLLLSDFKFNGNGLDDLANSPPMQVSGFSFTNGAIQLTDAGFLVGNLPGSAKINGFNYNSFTVALDFNPSDFLSPHRNILSGGPGYRWLGLENDELGHLELRFNNGSYLFALTNIVQSNSWHTLVCSVDLVSQPTIGRVVLFLDGQQLLDTALDNFQFNVPPANLDAESIFSFRNGGNATTLSGCADNLRVYRRALAPSEITSLLSARIAVRRFGQSLLVYWPTDLNGYVLESTPSLLAPISWSIESRPPAVVGDQYLIIDDGSAGTKFYRLRSQ